MLGVTEAQLQDMGFGAGQSRNITTEIQRLRTEPLADNLLLGSIGIHSLGRGASEKVLKKHRIDTVLSLTAEDLLAIEGFAQLSATGITKGLQDNSELINFLLDFGFNLQHSSDIQPASVSKATMEGIKVVFTGKMQRGSRDEMKSDAKSRGATVQSSVSKATDYLICGEKVGQSKTSKAEALGVRVLSEDQYLSMFF